MPDAPTWAFNIPGTRSKARKNLEEGDGLVEDLVRGDVKVGVEPLEAVFADGGAGLSPEVDRQEGEQDAAEAELPWRDSLALVASDVVLQGLPELVEGHETPLAGTAA